VTALLSFYTIINICLAIASTVTEKISCISGVTAGNNEKIA